LAETDTPGIAAFAHQMAAAWHKAQLMEDLQRSLQDLTDAQEQLLQADKLESIGRLAGGIAHDFSNLLTVMLGHAQLALDRPKLGSTLRMHLSEIQTAARRAAKMTGQLLAFSRREILQKRPLDVNELISEFSEMLARTIGEHIELQLDLAPRLEPTLADADALGRVLMNLVLNARDAMPNGGVLCVATAQVYLDEARCHSRPEASPGDHIRLTVSDTGVGMSKGTQDHLFEPFFTTKEPGSGTGLGLAMAYGVLKQHNGWIEIDSAVAEGTTVHVYLPVHTGTAEETAEHAEASALPTGTETILLAEDEPAVQRFARGVLEGLGYSVLAAADGEEALELFATNDDRVDLLVLDAVMPRMSGSNAYAAMRGLRTNIPVLFITGYSEEIARLTSEIGKTVNILRKPFGPADLAFEVREVLDGANRGTATDRDTLDIRAWQG
jgi:signal transduction histidine kinase/ActR/RegA family two-component response regulator